VVVKKLQHGAFAPVQAFRYDSRYSSAALGPQAVHYNKQLATAGVLPVLGAHVGHMDQKRTILVGLLAASFAGIIACPCLGSALLYVVLP
jgi:hypothetical protein